MNSELAPERAASRQLLMFAVLAVAFLLPIIGSVRVVLGTRHLHPRNPQAFIFGISYQLFGLLCLCFALKYQRRKLSDIGLAFDLRVRELGESFAMCFVALASTVFAYLVAKVSLESLWGHGFPTTYEHSAVFGTSVTIFTWLYVFINAFHEELIVRAYLITEAEALYRSTTFAAAASVAVQVSYHLYQGWPAALSHIPAFLLFSAYYIRTRRILPVVLAHMFMDVVSLGIYARHLH